MAWGDTSILEWEDPKQSAKSFWQIHTFQWQFVEWGGKQLLNRKRLSFKPRNTGAAALQHSTYTGEHAFRCVGDEEYIYCRPITKQFNWKVDKGLLLFSCPKDKKFWTSCLTDPDNMWHAVPNAASETPLVQNQETPSHLYSRVLHNWLFKCFL